MESENFWSNCFVGEAICEFDDVVILLQRRLQRFALRDRQESHEFRQRIAFRSVQRKDQSESSECQKILEMTISRFTRLFTNDRPSFQPPDHPVQWQERVHFQVRFLVQLTAGQGDKCEGVDQTIENPPSPLDHFDHRLERGKPPDDQWRIIARHHLSTIFFKASNQFPS